MPIPEANLDESREGATVAPPRPLGEEAVLQAVHEFQAGHRREENFRLLTERFYQPVLRFFSKRIFSSDQCLDLTQETFLRIYTGLDGFRGEARFSNWLFRIAYTTHLKWLRRRTAEPVPAPNPPEPAWNQGEPIAVSPRPSQLDRVLDEEKRGKLREAIGTLPPQMQSCIALRVYQELTYREIAELMELSIDTVKAHLAQARKRLRETLKDTFADINL